MDDEIVEREMKAVGERLDQDCRAAALAYAVKRGMNPDVAGAFIDGASWMLERVPQFYASVAATVPSQCHAPKA